MSAHLPEDVSERPEFDSVRLAVDPDRAVDAVESALKGLAVARTDDGVVFRTKNGMLVALITGTHYEDPVVELRYRTGPPSERATRKARRLREALDAYVE